MNFWTAFVLYLVASAIVYLGLSLNKADGQTTGGDAHGHDAHGAHH